LYDMTQHYAQVNLLIDCFLWYIMAMFILFSKSITIVILFVRYSSGDSYQRGIPSWDWSGHTAHHKSHAVRCVSMQKWFMQGQEIWSLKRIDPRLTTPFPGSLWAPSHYTLTIWNYSPCAHAS
jgi:hypothetical protein